MKLDVCGQIESELLDLSVDLGYSWITVECVDNISVSRRFRACLRARVSMLVDVVQ